jgi:hypothetical protein
MRYMSRGQLLFAGVGASVLAVTVAMAASLATRNLYLPVVPDLGDEPAALGFLLLPVAGVVAFGRRSGHSPRFIAAAAILTAALVMILSMAVWIGWIVVECGIQDNRCFD